MGILNAYPHKLIRKKASFKCKEIRAVASSRPTEALTDALASVISFSFVVYGHYKHSKYLVRELNHGRGGSRIFLVRGAPLRNGVTNANKPHTSCNKKSQVISRGGGGVRTPCTLSLDPSLNGPIASVIRFSWTLPRS